jgi:hypothetical protein
MLWVLMVACGGQANECQKADEYLRWVDEDGLTEADRDLEGTGYATSDCGDEAADEPECERFVEMNEVLDTCSSECERLETDAWKECDVACREAAEDGPHTDEAAWFLCSQDCPDQPTWTCD